jgi:hypothetical protein
MVMNRDRLTAAQLGAQVLLPEDAIKFAIQLLADGDTNPLTMQLASLSEASPSDRDMAFRLLESVLEHRGYTVPSQEDAYFCIGLDMVDRISNGDVDPVEGARRIWQVVWSRYHFAEFAPFVALLDEVEEARSDRDRRTIVEAISKRAREMTGE